MFDLWSAGHSVLREKVLEHVFLAELSKVLLLRMRVPFEVLRAEFDAHGYDVVLEARGIVRHVQLKAMRAGGKRRSVDVSVDLARKPGGCVIWHVVDEQTLELGPFYWLGGAPGAPLPPLEGRVARHTKANAQGVKSERRGLREVRMSAFSRLGSMEAVAEALFGPADHRSLLHGHLAERGVDFGQLALPEGLTWADSADLAHMIDGYALAEQAGLGDPFEYPEQARAEAERRGAWCGSTLELWVALFLEHRRQKFGSVIGMDAASDPPPILDDLCDALLRSIRADRTGHIAGGSEPSVHFETTS